MVNNKIIIGILVIIGAIAYLIISSTQVTAQYFLTIDELIDKKDIYSDKIIRISGAVIGNSIKYQPKDLTLAFDIVHIPADNTNINSQVSLAKNLHEAVNDRSRNRLSVVYHGPKPDLLKNEAQVIATGKLMDHGIFEAKELLLKCPTKYNEALPEQSN